MHSESLLPFIWLNCLLGVLPWQVVYLVSWLYVLGRPGVVLGLLGSQGGLPLAFDGPIEHFLLVVVDVALGPHHVLLVLLETLDVGVEGVPVPLHKHAEDQLVPRGRSAQRGLQQRVESLRLLHVLLPHRVQTEHPDAQQRLAREVLGQPDHNVPPLEPVAEVYCCLGQEDLVGEDGRQGPLQHFTQQLVVVPHGNAKVGLLVHLLQLFPRGLDVRHVQPVVQSLWKFGMFFHLIQQTSAAKQRKRIWSLPSKQPHSGEAILLIGCLFLTGQIFYPTVKLNMQETHEQKISYSKKMGSFRPKFEGKPDDYYELDCRDASCAISVCLIIVVFFFFLTVAFFFWSNNVSTENLVLVWSIVLCVFVPAFMVAAYMGSNNKMEVEERLIREALNKIIDKKDRKQEGKEGKQEKNEVSMSTNKIFIEGGV